ncbi:MAG: flavin reductase, partial [Firmicutes bacterium]|nr:flavin reductase [Bacillota bacterium]
MNYECNPFEKFHTQWALVTAGTKESFNTMTIAWGSMGTLWNKPVITVYIRPDRHTCNFIKEQETFTVSFYNEEHRPALRQLGTLSGRDCDKVAQVGFEPEFLEDGITFRQASETFVCKKIYAQQLNWEDV